MGFGTIYGQQYGIDESGVAYSFRCEDVVTAIDSVLESQSFFVRGEEVVIAEDSTRLNVDASRRQDEAVTAEDSTRLNVDASRRQDEAVIVADSIQKVVSYVIRHEDTITATDALVEGDHYFRRCDEVVTTVDWANQSPHAYSFRRDEVVSAVDTTPFFTTYDAPTASSLTLRQYAPLVDLGLVRSVLTTQARYYIARGARDGTLLVLVRFVLGSGWENPRWGELPPPSPEATEVTNPIFEGSIYDGLLKVEEANSSTFVLRCAGPPSLDFTPTEVMVYAEIHNSPVATENYREVPFACATFPSWFHVSDQRFVTRLVLPVG